MPNLLMAGEGLYPLFTNKCTFDMFLQDEDFFCQSFISLLLQEEFLFVLQEDFCPTKLEVAVSQDLVTDSRRGGSAVNLCQWVVKR